MYINFTKFVGYGILVFCTMAPVNYIIIYSQFLFHISTNFNVLSEVYKLKNYEIFCLH